MRRAPAARDRGGPRPVRPRRAGGFTLMEALIASVILVLAIAALCQAVAAGQAQSADMLRAARGNLIAAALLEEVLSKAYAEPGGGTPPLGRDAGEAAGNRAAFDDVDDYHGFTEAAGLVADATATALPASYAEFSRSVAVTATTAPRPLSGTVAGKKIVVTVRSTRGGTWTAEHFVGAPQ